MKNPEHIAQRTAARVIQLPEISKKLGTGRRNEAIFEVKDRFGPAVARVVLTLSNDGPDFLRDDVSIPRSVDDGDR